ncbi:hypothetical protein ACFL26_00450 [Patescibacteria group bacterium]
MTTETENQTAGGRPDDLTLEAIYRRAWRLAVDNLWPFIGISLLIILFSVAAEAAEQVGQRLIMSQAPDSLLLTLIPTLLGGVLGILVLSPIGASVGWVFLKATRHEEYRIADMFAVFSRNYWNVVLAQFLVTLLIFAGFLLFIIPGLYLAVRMTFVPYLAIDRQMKATDAIKTSWEMTGGCFWTLVAMALIAIPVTVVGLFLFGIGILPAAVFLGFASAAVYHAVAVRNQPAVQ